MEPTTNPETKMRQQIRWKAMELLARREHSHRELLAKLSRHYIDSCELVEEVIDQLAAEGLQSDHRFMEAYVAMRKRRGYGPGRIGMELKDRGIDRDLIASEIARPEHDWYALAVDVWRKKFRLSTAESAGNTNTSARPAAGSFDAPALRQKSRQIRFLQYRGFSIDQIQAAIT